MDANENLSNDVPAEEALSAELSSNSSGAPSAPQFINLNEHKAGLDGLDKERINKIIQEASKGSNFYIFQQKRQKRIDGKIKQYQENLKHISDLQMTNCQLKADAVVVELEGQRILNRILVHFDMDMFFAAVEIKHNPSLADKPMAVGTMAMISTSNYIARKFGVRSAMAGFIAKKLCPELILIKHSRGSYSKESKFIMNIIAEYDPNLTCYSLDEVCIDLTNYVFTHYSNEKETDINDLYKLEQLPEEIWNYAFNVVNKIRARVFEESKLTVSCGISCNTRLAKVCTDINKPNGQFMVKGYKNEIIEFVSSIEVRKFSGVGPVRGQILSGLNIHTGMDIFNERAKIFALFTENDAYYYMRLCLGIGYSFLDSDDAPQKSHSRETTMGEVSKLDDLSKLLKDLARRLTGDLKASSQKAKTITLKLKKTTFEVFLKSKSIKTFTDDEQTILKVAQELLTQEVNRSPSCSYRLIGIKVSNLRDTDESTPPNSQPTLSQYLKNTSLKKQQGFVQPNFDDEVQQCRLCEQTFDDFSEFEMHQRSCEGNMGEIIFEDDPILEDEGEEIATGDICENEHVDNGFKEYENEHGDYLTCPICAKTTIFQDNEHFNRHIDTCLNRDLVKELTMIPIQSDSGLLNSTPSSSHKSKRPLSKLSQKKVKRLKSSSSLTNTQKKIEQFFTKK